MIEDGAAPQEVTLDLICEAFGIDPDRAVELDHDRTTRVLEARLARQAHQAMNNSNRPMSVSESATYQRLLDALDTRDEAAGVHPEAD